MRDLTSTRTTQTDHPVEPSSATDLGADPAAWRRRWPPLSFAVPCGLGIAVSFAAVFACDSIAPSPGEPGWLRWLRVFADHPVRGSIAASLLFIAFYPRTPDSADRGGSRSA